MIVDRDAIRRNDHSAIRQLHTLVWKVARGIARRYGLTADADDIAQDVMLATLRAVSVKRDDEHLIHIEGFIQEAARRLSLTQLRMHARTYSVDSPETFDALQAGDLTDSTLDAVAESQHQQRIDRALVEARRMRSTPQTAPTVAPLLGTDRKRVSLDMTSEAVSARRAQRAIQSAMRIAALPKNARRIRQVRDMVGMTQHQFANFLNVSIHTLRNYEYGSVNNVPADFMMAIAKTKDRAKQNHLANRESFLKTVHRWMRLLGLPKEAQAELARTLGLNRSTVWRWFKYGIAPPSRVIAITETWVAEEVQRRRRVE